MHISWNYLDKKKATIDAVEAYDDMEYIIEHTDEEIASAVNRMCGVGSPGMDGLPHAYDPKAMEEKLVSGLDEIDVMKERYRQAVEFMEWFKPAWDKLSEDERVVLDAFYLSDGGASLASDHLGVEPRTTFRRRNKALDHLALLLYGKA